MLAAQRNVLRGPELTSSQWWELTSLPRHWVTCCPVCAVTTFCQDTLLCRVCCHSVLRRLCRLSMGETALWSDPISTSPRTLETVFEPAMWANFERLLTHPFHCASISGSHQFRGQRIRKSKPGSPQQPRTQYLLPVSFLGSERRLGMGGSVDCHCFEP